MKKIKNALFCIAYSMFLVACSSEMGNENASVSANELNSDSVPTNSIFDSNITGGGEEIFDNSSNLNTDDIDTTSNNSNETTEITESPIFVEEEMPVPVDLPIRLSWSAPDFNEDGSILNDLAGYKVYYGTTTGVYTESIDAGSDTTLVTPVLRHSRTYFFVITSYDRNGNESEYSQEIVVSI